MKYRLTPLNCFCDLLTGLEIIFFVFPETLSNVQYGYQHVYLIPVIISGFIIDLALQFIIKDYIWLSMIQAVLIVATIILNL